jgi:hypothetical protein
MHGDRRADDRLPGPSIKYNARCSGPRDTTIWYGNGDASR